MHDMAYQVRGSGAPAGWLMHIRGYAVAVGCWGQVLAGDCSSTGGCSITGADVRHMTGAGACCMLLYDK
jgi:hypothetical protein